MAKAEPLEGSVGAREDARGWLVQLVAYYRGLGFFAQDRDLSDEALAQRLAAAQRESGEPPFRSNDPLIDFRLLRHDRDRVWWGNPQANVVAEGVHLPDVPPPPDGRPYARLLCEWATISRGALVPRDVVEHWVTGAGPIEVTFALDGARRTLWPNYLEDRVDLSVLGRINDYIRGSGLRFECCEPLGRTAFVLVLASEEKERLVQERGWRFVDWDARRFDELA